MAKNFASTGDLAEKKITFSEIGTDLYAFTAEGDPNTAVIVGDDGCLVFDAQATPAMANKVIERVRSMPNMSWNGSRPWMEKPSPIWRQSPIRSSSCVPGRSK